MSARLAAEFMDSITCDGSFCSLAQAARSLDQKNASFNPLISFAHGSAAGNGATMTDHTAAMLQSRERDASVRIDVDRGDSNPRPQAMSGDTPAIAPDQLRGRPKMQMVVRLHYLSRWFFDRRLIALSRIVERLIRLVYTARIPAEAQIDPTVHFSHNALAVIITKMASIGPRCEIGVDVLLGSRWPRAGGPRLEGDVIVHAGAKIIGPVAIGRGSVIGANAVVVNDVPACSLAVGVPAIIKKRGIRIEDYLPKGEED
jgi:serine O-acetyltransferase